MTKVSHKREKFLLSKCFLIHTCINTFPYLCLCFWCAEKSVKTLSQRTFIEENSVSKASSHYLSKSSKIRQTTITYMTFQCTSFKVRRVFHVFTSTPSTYKYSCSPGIESSKCGRSTTSATSADDASRTPWDTGRRASSGLRVRIVTNFGCFLGHREGGGDRWLIEGDSTISQNKRMFHKDGVLHTASFSNLSREGIFGEEFFSHSAGRPLIFRIYWEEISALQRKPSSVSAFLLKSCGNSVGQWFFSSSCICSSLNWQETKALKKLIYADKLYSYFFYDEGNCV